MRFITLVALVLVVLLMSANAIAEEYPFLTDLGQLKLTIANTEVVNEILVTHAVGKSKLSAKKGYKLVVVTLKGIVTYSYIISIESNEFIAFYKEEITVYQSKKSDGRFENSIAVALRDTWVARPPTEEDIKTTICITYNYEPGPIIIKGAFILPEKVNDFLLYYPTLAGKAEVLPETEKI